MSKKATHHKAVSKYVKNNYDRVVLTMPKGHLDIIKGAANAQGQSVNSFLNFSVNQQMAQSGFYVLPELQAARELAAEDDVPAFPLLEALPGLTKAEQDILFHGTRQERLGLVDKITGILAMVYGIGPDEDEAKESPDGSGGALSPETLNMARTAAETAGETTDNFLERIIRQYSKRVLDLDGKKDGAERIPEPPEDALERICRNLNIARNACGLEALNRSAVSATSVKAAMVAGFALEEIEQAAMEAAARRQAVDWYTLGDYLEKLYGKRG